VTQGQSPLEIVEALTDAINRHDVDAIMRIVHDAHVFVDSLGNEIRGAAAVREAWESYLALVPDYWVRIDHGVLAPEYIALFGAAGGTLAVEGKLQPENWWETTAAWRAEIVDGRVAKWQVYADYEPIRSRMKKRPQPKKGKATKKAHKKAPQKASKKTQRKTLRARKKPARSK
jgi:limonene-1,2-epoxide hydrolase